MPENREFPPAMDGYLPVLGRSRPRRHKQLSSETEVIADLNDDFPSEGEPFGNTDAPSPVFDYCL
jgi:hypothetical protein